AGWLEDLGFRGGVRLAHQLGGVDAGFGAVVPDVLVRVMPAGDHLRGLRRPRRDLAIAHESERVGGLLSFLVASRARARLPQRPPGYERARSVVPIDSEPVPFAAEGGRLQRRLGGHRGYLRRSARGRRGPGKQSGLPTRSRRPRTQLLNVLTSSVGACCGNPGTRRRRSRAPWSSPILLSPRRRHPHPCHSSGTFRSAPSSSSRRQSGVCSCRCRRRPRARPCSFPRPSPNPPPWPLPICPVPPGPSSDIACNP